MLTKKQRELLLFIHRTMKKEGVPPSYEEMKVALGLHSKSGIHRLVKALEERGFLKRLPNRARAIEIIRMPDALTPGGGYGEGLGEANVISAPFGRSGPKDIPAASHISVPLHGRIAAGAPIEALENVHETLSLPPGMIGKGEHYALEISGDSMVDLGILDGDTVVILKCHRAESGDVVVALVDDEEATLKILHKKGAQVALKPANSSQSTQILPAERVKIQGKLVGLLRKY